MQHDYAIRQVGSKPVCVMPYATDPEADDRLWCLNEQLTGGRSNSFQTKVPWRFRRSYRSSSMMAATEPGRSGPVLHF